MRKLTLLTAAVLSVLFLLNPLYAGRYYIPEIGRFATPDPALQKMHPNELVGFKGGALLKTSPYVYANNNPLRYVDPDGNTFWDVLDIAALGLSAKDFYQNPTWANAGWLATDVVGVLPVVPSTGIFRHGFKLLAGSDKALDIIKGAERLHDMGSALKRIEGTSDLSASTLKAFNRIDNNVGHLSALDISGAVKELNGIQIVTKDGKVLNHVDEVRNALKGMKKGMIELQGSLGDPNLSKEARKLIEGKI